MSNGNVSNNATESSTMNQDEELDQGMIDYFMSDDGRARIEKINKLIEEKLGKND